MVSSEVIEQLLDSLPSMYERTREQDAQLGPALEAIKNAMVRAFVCARYM